GSNGSIPPQSQLGQPSRRDLPRRSIWWRCKRSLSSKVTVGLGLERCPASFRGSYVLTAPRARVLNRSRDTDRGCEGRRTRGATQDREETVWRAAAGHQFVYSIKDRTASLATVTPRRRSAFSSLPGSFV